MNIDFVYGVIAFTIVAWFLLMPVNKIALTFLPPWKTWKVRLPIAILLGIIMTINYYTLGILVIVSIVSWYFIKKT